jgi:TonB-linked SusC/RagA family outer membrane protein
MRLRFLYIAMLVVFCTVCVGRSHAQELLTRKVSINADNTSLLHVIEEIQKQVSIRFVYSPNIIDDNKKVTLHCTDKSLQQLFDEFLPTLNIAYKLINKNKVLLFAGQQKDSPSKLEEINITGTVTDENSNPLPNASILINEGTAGTQTNEKGNFSIKFKQLQGIKVELQVSYVNYQSQTIIADGRSKLSIQLQKLSTALDDVVVIGYGSSKRKDVSASIASINARDLKDNPLSSSAEALQGRLAGVQLTSSEGMPGAEIIVRVRGGSSITQDNSPIYIVDGVQVENALSVIAPQDIASLDVLKDAASTSIYGARGANGVIIITTKAGKPGRTIINYNASFGWRELPKQMNVLSPYEFITWQYERSRGNVTDSTNFVKTYGTTWDTLKVYRNLPAINWQDKVFGRNAAYQNHHVAVSGGNQSTTFNLSFTANKEDGLQLESGFDRKLMNFKLDHKANDKFKMGLTVRYLDQTVTGAGTSNTGTRTTNKLRHSIVYRPFDIPTLPSSDQFDETYYLSSNQVQNPLILTQSEYRKQYNKATYLTGFISYNIFKKLVFKSVVGFDNVNIKQDQFYSKLTPTARMYGSLPVASIGQQNNTSITNSNTLQYTASKAKHFYSLLIGEETVDVNSKSTYIETRFFPSEIAAEKALANMNLGSPPSGSSQPLPTSNVNPPSRIISFFGRFNYAYDNRYLLSLNFRDDRSSKFSYNKGALVFPSGSVAWRFSKEKSMQRFSWLTDGKLRLGYGVVGNNRIGDLLYEQLYGVTGVYALNHAVLPGFAPTALANPNLTWEKNISTNLGLDLSFFKGRLQFSMDVYKNKANDLLLAVAIPPTVGYTSQLQNLGATSNKGVELQLDATVFSKKDFSWTSSLNISFNKNKVESLGGITQLTRSSGWQGTDGADDYLVKVGEPIGLMYGFVTDGFYQINDFNYSGGVYTLKAGIPSNASLYGAPQPGSIKLKDINGDGVVNTDGDRTIIGNANARFTGGWNNRVSYKNVDASIFMNFVVGNDIYNANKIEWVDGSFPNLNMLGMMKNRFTYINAQGQRVTDPTTLAALNANASIWAPVRTQRYYLHSWAIEDGSYLRINNITLGYTLPKKILNKIKMVNVRLYATVNNLATITGYSGYDPDVTTRRSDPLTPGVDFAAYPKARTYVFGLNVGF